ncbi:MAG: MASE2 domain-containing protein [Pseudomonas sp.]
MLVYIAIAATITAGTFAKYFGFDILWMIPYALLYPHLAQQVSRRFKRDNPQRTRLVLLFIDALHAGIATTLPRFSEAPQPYAGADSRVQALFGLFCFPINLSNTRN